MTKAALLFSILFLCSNAAALELSTTKVWKGSEGQLVEVGTLVPASQGALVRVRQSGSPHDGLVLRCTIEDRGRDRAFVTRYHGSTYELLRVGEGAGRANFPEVKDFAVKFLEDASGKGAELVAEHEKQLASGALAMFEKKAFPYLVTKYEAKAAAANAELNKACGGAAHFSYEWSSFPDEAMENLDVWAACQPLVTQARAKCATVKGVDKLVCRMGPSLGLSRTSGAITFTTTTKGAADGPSFVAAQLRK